MANEFKVKHGLIVNGSGSVVLDVQGSQGQLFSITDSLSGSLFKVSDISGIPIVEVFSDDTVNIGTYGQEAIKVDGSSAKVSGSFSGSLKGTANLTNLDVNGNTVITGSLYITDGVNGDYLRIYQDGNGSFRLGSSAIGDVMDMGAANQVDFLGQRLYSAQRGAYFNATVSGVSPLQVGSSGLFIESGSYNVGIGTTSPGGKLDVAGDTDATTILGRAKFGSYTTDYLYLSHFDLGNSTSYALKQSPAGSTALNAASGQNINLNVNNSSILSIVGATSKVGIGTTSPSTALQVAGTISGSDVYIDDWGSVSASLATFSGAGSGTVTSVGGTGTVNGISLSGTVTTSGNLTLGGTLTINNSDWSGTDLSLANGGTGASLTDPGADRILFWDDSAGTVTWLTAGSNITISGTTISSTDTNTIYSAGTGLDLVGTQFSVDVSDFMTNGADNRVVTATGTDGMNAEANLTFDGSTLAVTGSVIATSFTGSILADNGVISSSAQVNADSITNFDTNVKDKLNTEAVLSGSDYATLSTDQTFTGTKTFNDIVVNGTGSFVYIESITGTSTAIGESFIVLNTAGAQRYAGISVIDSGSEPATGSFFFDSELNNWNYEYTDGTVDYAVALFGPEYNTKGSPTYNTNNTIVKSDGGHHLLDSNITDNGTTITLGSNTTVSGKLEATSLSGSMSGSFEGDGSGLTGINLTLGTDTTGNYVSTITAGTGLVSTGDTSGEGEAHTLSLDFSELTDMTSAISETTEFIVLNGSTESRKAAGEIDLSNFNNDFGWTNNTGTVTSVGGTGAVNGITLSGTVTTSGSLTLGGTLAINNNDWSGADLSLANGGTGASLTDPNADRILFWDDSAGAVTWLAAGTNITISGTTISATDTNTTYTAGTGLDLVGTQFSVDVSDFMTNGANNRVVTATGTDAMNAEANLTFDGTTLNVSGKVIASSLSGSFSGSFEGDGSGLTGLVDIASAQTITGTKTFTDIVVNGTGSFSYIESVSGTSTAIGESFIVLNNATPTQRYAGIAVQDSSQAGVTGSFFFDGTNNDWAYEYTTGATTDYAVALFGPEFSTKGTPTYLTNNTIPKSTGDHHLADSNITDSGTLITLGSNTSITGTIVASGTTLFSGSQQVIDSLLNQDVDFGTGDISASSGSFSAPVVSTQKMFAVDFVLSSDERIKENIQPLDIEAPEVEWKSFNITGNNKTRYGVIAQELEKTNPELVSEGVDGTKSVSYIDLLVLKMAEKDRQIQQLQKDIEVLKMLISK